MAPSATDRRTRTRIHLLWGRSDRFPRPQLVTAFSAGLVNANPEEHEARRNDAISWFLDYDVESTRGDWTFWETAEELLIVAPAICSTCRRVAQDPFEACECKDPELVATCECGEGPGHTRYCPSGPAPGGDHDDQ